APAKRVFEKAVVVENRLRHPIRQLGHVGIAQWMSVSDTHPPAALEPFLAPLRLERVVQPAHRFPLMKWTLRRHLVKVPFLSAFELRLQRRFRCNVRRRGLHGTAHTKPMQRPWTNPLQCGDAQST